MLSHINLGTNDLAAALAFYTPILTALGLRQRFHQPELGWAAWQGAAGGRPLLVISRPFDGQPHAPGNGQMVAFSASSRAVVDDCHALALASGGTCEGPPGLRPHYHANYYGAYFRDRDGNKVCVVCHDA